MHRVPVWLTLLLVCAAVGATYFITEKTVSARYDALIKEFASDCTACSNSFTDDCGEGKFTYVICKSCGFEARRHEGDSEYVVTSLDVGGAAYGSGLQAADIIIALNGEIPDDASVEGIKSGDIIRVKRLSGAEPLNYDLVIW
jgi:predicted metalloprotease with PDZ domain